MWCALCLRPCSLLSMWGCSPQVWVMENVLQMSIGQRTSGAPAGSPTCMQCCGCPGHLDWTQWREMRAWSRPCPLKMPELEKWLLFLTTYTEWNCAKEDHGQETVIGPAQDAKLRGSAAPVDSCSTAWHSPAQSGVDWGGLASLLFDYLSPADAETSFDKRVALMKELAPFCQMHDWHMPCATGPPQKNQSCARCPME